MRRVGLWRPRFPSPWGRWVGRPGTLPRPKAWVSLGAGGRQPPGRVAPVPSYPFPKRVDARPTRNLRLREPAVSSCFGPVRA